LFGTTPFDGFLVVVDASSVISLERLATSVHESDF